MVKTLERFHSFTVCPECKAEVAPHHRFCRFCTYWLARPDQHGLRPVDPPDHGTHWSDSLWGIIDLVKNFRASIHFVVIGVSLGAVGTMVLVLVLHSVAPEWANYGPRAQQRACYANLRVIQGALEAYLQENRFTPALASDPVGVLVEKGFLQNRPHCPITGNSYRIPRGFGLQCIGSEGHGLP
ncbi:MAG: hypothetical protein OZSIB_4337 [Candidatus Ozemobacter sibiricus]|jgi:ribosomal protein L40E|uniref:Uncharacterized protein n=1 Tax=Candidatus Ozemobacter sibiricus TaxID=2268124 RepID=A0A367ZN91_9BACT|nr:MAG: hypothetical protein OZSIB_4337 [Candidatus Ozemobacter sibiricus]